MGVVFFSFGGFGENPGVAGVFTELCQPGIYIIFGNFTALQLYGGLEHAGIGNFHNFSIVVLPKQRQIGIFVLT
jgi:hypothetical protein